MKTISWRFQSNSNLPDNFVTPFFLYCINSLIWHCSSLCPRKSKTLYNDRVVEKTNEISISNLNDCSEIFPNLQLAEDDQTLWLHHEILYKH